MSSFDWESFLRQWSQDILASMREEQLTQLPSSVIQSGWLGYPGATEEQIAQTETRLRVKLPPSYREFLKVTNGWRQTTSFIRRLWSTEGIEKFALRHQKWIDDFINHHEHTLVNVEDGFIDDFWEPPSVPDSDYFVYGDDQDCSKLRIEYLKTAIEISDVGEASIYLLNPDVINQEGEWEAWFFGDWLPGADRYPSFQAMMEAEYRNFLEQRDAELAQEAIQTIAPLPLATPSAPVFNTPSVIAAEPELELWRSLKRLTVEFQTRQVGDRLEYRTVTSAQGEPQNTWAGLGERKLQQWLQTHLTGDIPRSTDLAIAALPTAPAPPTTTACEQTQPTPAITLQIDQLAIRQGTRHAAAIVVQPTTLKQPKKTGYASLSSQQPFALEVVLHLVGQNLPDLRTQPATYKIQCHAQSRTTGEWIVLGETRPDRLESDRHTYTAYLFGNRLEPGMYRLQVLTLLHGSVMGLTSFELPLLNVV